MERLEKSQSAIMIWLEDSANWDETSKNIWEKAMWLRGYKRDKKWDGISESEIILEGIR